ncbi:NYN domain-containing protein [Candidatus Nomurabacteria bacterium]|uniref:NYN domain-containing protein n=1 Tax=candidate division WWE3 bacterium TaxID=2053526 RepID=A0A955IX70_UNCKA|nr:NYN domain-containing protein [candidate division WWE3 bacterium]MCB9823391.1 NYN domain-containing protein [Candidatus Nomurabacteria bacterium]MCB9827673.1 NYN domain-containing protein [Candidatus Nomurabacteria bacterium]HXK52842.1 NYN domain-containing protein [bacterium]
MNADTTKHPEQRVAIFADVQNMYYSAKNLYSGKVDFGRILTESVGNRRLVRAFAYVIKADVGLEKEFFDALTQRGYEVKAKELQIFIDGSKKGDWDVGLCMDVVRMLPKIDVMVLISGDGDYIHLLQYAKSQGVRTEVVAFSKTGSTKLFDEADDVIDMCADPKKYIIRKPRIPFIPKGVEPKPKNNAGAAKNDKS